MSKTTTPPRHEFFAGARAELPILFGVIPFGLIYGVAATKAGLSPLMAILMSSVIFAGSAQLITTQLIRVGTPSLVIILTDAIVNLRHALYSASVGPYTRHLSWLWKVILAYLLTDEAYAVAIARYLKNEAAGAHPENAHWYFLGAGLTLWIAWQTSTAFGVLVGGQVPERWGLDFTLALTFIALTVPVLKDRPTMASAVAAGVVAVLAYSWPYKLGLMAAACAGIAVGIALESRERNSPETAESVANDSQQSQAEGAAH